MNLERLKATIREHKQELVSKIEKVSDDIEVISMIAGLTEECLREGKKVMWAGNGGSATQASHYAAELVGRYKKKRAPYKSISLSVDLGAITCIANDYGYAEVFSRQVEALGDPEDLLIVMSTSGLSCNIVNAVKVAKTKGIRVVGLLGGDGGSVKDICDIIYIVDSKETSIIQEVHGHICHIICEYSEG